jgi:DNA-binding MarR family transcriptional regulator
MGMARSLSGDPVTTKSVSELAVSEILKCLPIIHEKFIRSIERSEDGIFTQLQSKAMAIIASCGPLPMHEIASRMDMSKQQLTRFIDTLVQRGMLHRFNKQRDRRTIYIEATPEGREALEEHCRRTESKHLEIVMKLSPKEQEALYRAASEFRRMLNKCWGDNESVPENTYDDTRDSAVQCG